MVKEPIPQAQVNLNNTNTIRFRSNNNDYWLYIEDLQGAILDQGIFSYQEMCDTIGEDLASKIKATASNDNQMIKGDEIPRYPNVYERHPEYVEQLLNDARKSYQINNRCYETVGYLLPDGNMLDLANGEEFRDDHICFPGGLKTAMEIGCIRMMPEVGGFEILADTPPNKAQIETILRYLEHNECAQEEGTFVAISSSSKMIGRNDVAALKFDVGTKPINILEEVMSHVSRGQTDLELPDPEALNQQVTEIKEFLLAEDIETAAELFQEFEDQFANLIGNNVPEAIEAYQQCIHQFTEDEMAKMNERWKENLLFQEEFGEI